MSGTDLPLQASATPGTVRLRYLRLTMDDALRSLLDTGAAAAALRVLGIEPAEGPTQLARWLSAMAQETGRTPDEISQHVRVLSDPSDCFTAGLDFDPALPAFIFLLA